MTSARPVILLVEDSGTQALRYRALLEQEGFEVVWDASGEAALERLNNLVPDLLVVDHHLPGMSGGDLIRQIRMNVGMRGLPILMLTEAREPDSEQRGLETGADAYLPKSARLDLLVLRIHALVRRGTQSSDVLKEVARDRSGGFRRARIAIVDDRAGFSAHLQELLAGDGFEVVPFGGTSDFADAGSFDCILVSLISRSFDGMALLSRLDHARIEQLPPEQSFELVGIGGGEERAEHDLVARGFLAGADDIIAQSVADSVWAARIRALVRRKLLRDEDLRIAMQRRARELALDHARAQAAAADALARANRELAQANERLSATQAQLVQAAKMASLGELVAGIAHEINNPLAFILGHHATVERLIGRVRDGIEDRPEIEAALRKCTDRLGSMRTGLTRIQELVLKLRRFSRLDEGEFQTLNVPEAIDTVVALLSHKLSDRISIERRYSGPAELYCSPALFNQVVMNILSNAADAIDGIGTIRIHTAQQGERFEVAISDSGPGVPPELRQRIFEPFFTSKAPGSGTGLGLAIAYTVVQSHGGDLEVKDGPLGGACFMVRVPLRS